MPKSHKKMKSYRKKLDHKRESGQLSNLEVRDFKSVNTSTKHSTRLREKVNNSSVSDIS